MDAYKPPNLPGYSFHDPRNVATHKHQYFQVCNNGLMFAQPPTLGTIQQQLHEHEETISMRAPTHLTSSSFTDSGPPSDLPTRKTGGRFRQKQTTSDIPKSSQVGDFNQPQPIETHDQQQHASDSLLSQGSVLRFNAYFRESVPECPDETQRVRYVRISVFLEDNTIMVEENHQRNSGIPQGTLLRRMLVMNPNAANYGDNYTVSDFRVGINIEMYGRVYHIYACDHFTEDYFHEMGVDVGTFEEPPDDLYSIKRKLTERPIRVTTINTDKTNLRRFLDFDGKVLRFYCTWDDTRSLYGERRKFVINYFLVDGTVEVRQILPPNSGRDPMSQFLKKTKLTKPSGEPYTELDFEVGATVNVFGRDFEIYDADDFTKKYLDDNYGPHDWRTQGPGDAPPKQRFQAQPAPYNGWGDEDDSLGYCTSLHPAPPRKDFVKMLNKAGDIIRFGAVFADPAPQDRDREFVIAFYLADDTLAVFERPVRNSGFHDGKFLQRGKYKNGAANFAAADFKVGEEITINSFAFRITTADEYALSYMEANGDEFPQSDLFDIVMGLRPQAANLRSLFEAVDPDLDGWIFEDQATQILVNDGGVDPHAALTIVRRWSDENKVFDYLGFLSAM